MVRRRPGPDGKLVNEWLGDQDREPGSNPGQVSEAFPVTGALASAGTVQNAGAVPAGDSAEQRGAERVMLDLLGAQLGSELNPATITVPSGERVQVDGADAGRMVLAECWVHQGPPKSAQRHKVLADAFKLAWIATTLYPRPQLILCLSDPLAAAPAPSATTPVPLTTQAVSPPAATARNGKTSEGLTPERWNR
jgi:hypothetical protein